MLLGIILTLLASLALMIVGMFVPRRWEEAVMGLSVLLSVVALCVLTAAWALGFQLAA